MYCRVFMDHGIVFSWHLHDNRERCAENAESESGEPRRTTALHHQNGQRVAESMSTACLTEACNCYTASEENGAGLI